MRKPDCEVTASRIRTRLRPFLVALGIAFIILLGNTLSFTFQDEMSFAKFLLTLGLLVVLLMFRDVRFLVAGPGLRTSLRPRWAFYGVASGLILASLISLMLVQNDSVLASYRGLSPPLSIFWVLVSGTLTIVVFEEVIFRGLIYAATPQSPVLWSTLAFAAWHIVPALNLINSDSDAGGGVRLAYLVGALVGVGFAGLLWGMLRRQSGGIWPAILSHWLTISIPKLLAGSL
jgi:membrane protease YdiL (CAAX protease family)